MEFGTIVSCMELLAHLDNPDWVVLDCRHMPFDFQAGYSAYSLSHIPGARFAHTAHDLSGASGSGKGRHPLPDPKDFVQTLQHWGIDNNKQIVAYDDSGSIYAARLWWMLRWVGHYRVAVLDGGWGKWGQEIGLVTSQASSVPVSKTTHFWLNLHNAAQVNVDFMERNLESDYLRIIDARPPRRFIGVYEQQDPVGGHIPGAINRFFKKNLDANQCFLSPTTLRMAFTPLIGVTPLHRVIHQCGAGITACNNILAMEIAGLQGSKLYPGSWSEWCSNPRRPMAAALLAPVSNL